MADLEIKIHGAKDLKDVKKVGTMHTYVVAWVQRPGASYTADQDADKVMTHPDKKGGCHPLWDETHTLPVSADMADLQKSFIIFHLYTSSLIMPDDTVVGTAVMPLADLFLHTDASSGRPLFLSAWQSSSIPVQRPSLRYQGSLSFSVRLTVPGPVAASRAASMSSQRLPNTLLNNPMMGGGGGANFSGSGSSGAQGGGGGGGANAAAGAAAAVASMMLF